MSGMPSPRWLVILALALPVTGCRDRSLEQRTEQIRELSDREDRAYAEEALDHIRHNYWTLRDGGWDGKLQDGTIIRLESPHATAAPLLSREGYRGWHLQLTITSDDWRTYPPATHTGPFETVYAITRYSATSWDIRVTQGDVTSPLRRGDLAVVGGIAN